jgi:hypothetical protein
MCSLPAQENIVMEQQKQGMPNSPSHQAQVKGGENSLQSGSKTFHQPSSEAPAKGGPNSHNGSQR